MGCDAAPGLDTQTPGCMQAWTPGFTPKISHQLTGEPQAWCSLSSSPPYLGKDGIQLPGEAQLSNTKRHVALGKMPSLVP